MIKYITRKIYIEEPKHLKTWQYVKTRFKCGKDDFKVVYQESDKMLRQKMRELLDFYNLN